MNELSNTVDSYLCGWNEADPQLRASIVGRVWAATGSLIDPPLAANGHDEIVAMAGTLQSQFPDHHFVRTSGIDEHHPKIFGELRLYMHIAAQGAVQQIPHGGKLQAQIDGLGFERLATSEGQQLAAQ